MWTRLKRKFLQLFTESKTDEQSQVKNEHTTNIDRQEIHHERKRSFRFPVIPDHPIESTQVGESRAFKNKEMPMRHQRRQTEHEHKIHHRQSTESITPLRSGQTNKRFVPSRVASPIYGYNKRTDAETIEQVPTFIRNKRTEKQISEINMKQDSELIEPSQVSGKINNTNKPVTNFAKDTLEKSTSHHKQKHKNREQALSTLHDNEANKAHRELAKGKSGLAAKEDGSNNRRKEQLSIKDESAQAKVSEQNAQTTVELQKEQVAKNPDDVIERTTFQSVQNKPAMAKQQDVQRSINNQSSPAVEKQQATHVAKKQHSPEDLVDDRPAQLSTKQQRAQDLVKDEPAQTTAKHDTNRVHLIQQNDQLIEKRMQNKQLPLSEHKQRPSKQQQIDQSQPEQKQQRSSKQRQRPSKKRNRREGTTQQTSSTVPFNVMMTPADYRLLAKKATAKKSYTIPYHLLNDPVAKSTEDEQWVVEQIEILERTLKHFNVDDEVVHATQGPTVTRFEVKPAIGVKVSRVRNLSDDIKLNMAAKDSRIEAPIPGKNTIGIEIPNLYPQMVSLQEILQADEFQQTEKRLPIGLGLTVEGKPLVTTISKMPHGLIAGATGSGKSVCINTILLSLIYKESYDDLKLLLIDPKMVELAPYNGIPHLVSPVITDVKAATAALKWAVNEMEERYEKFVNEGVRDINRYNEKMAEEGKNDAKLPYIVIVIDELADLMMVSPQDVEDAICRIAQKARAAGMHLIIATQRPSVDVITGLIKANIPTRIAFSVSSQVDSRTILDSNGAERLLGKGDMLFVENGSGKGVRLQGAFVSDEEIDRVTSHLRKLAPANYLFEQEQLLKQIELDEEEDELFPDAIQFILEQNQASTSMLQRHFRIGYNRAARLIDSLEAKGIISGPQGSKPRQVLMKEEQLDEIINR